MSPDPKPRPVQSEPPQRAVLPPASPWKIITAVCVVFVLVTAAVIAFWSLATRGLTGVDLVTARLDALKVGLGLGVGSGGLFALYLTWRRQRAIEAELDNRERALLHQLRAAADANTDAIERRVTELYTKAVDQLGADKAAVRLGGLYALERLAQGNSEHRQTVVNVLCAYLRMPYRLPDMPPADGDDQHRQAEFRQRVQEREVRLAAQHILVHHLIPGDIDRFWDDISLELSGANLIDFDLRACRVGPARFERATFIGLARFDGATFTGLARFDSAIFTGGAHFSAATFAGDASFDGATGLRGDDPMSSKISLVELLELGDPYEFDPADTWRSRPNRDRLRVKIGIRSDGMPINLDLKESAQGGMGPHGLLVGATGSGKSELLRTLVLALAVTHPPSSLNFVLIDFKGGASYARLNALPHTSAVITNLAAELHLIDRIVDAINGELVRRQELLRKAANYVSLHHYERARAAGAPLPELPMLLIICDEFSELVSAKPDFIDLFVKIGRLGRSLGVHLLVASQRFEEGRLRGLESFLSYRIALRTSSEAESRLALGAPDASRLPRAPGHGFIKVGIETMERFRAANCGVYVRGTGIPVPAAPQRQRELNDYTTTAISLAEPDAFTPEPTPETTEDDTVGETMLDILVDRLTGHGTPAHQIWLPPLAESPTLNELLPALVTHPERGLTAEPAGTLRPVLGIVDRPLEHRRDPLVLDLAGAEGHVLVVGGPQAGKSTTLRTLITSLALTHTPLHVQFYCLDFGGGTLSALRRLPHVGGVADRWDIGAVRRTVVDLQHVVTDRETRFAEHDVDSMASYRQARQEDSLGKDPYGDVFLVVDGWGTLRNEFEDLEEEIFKLATRGSSNGVHVVVSCSRWSDLRPGLRDLFGTRIELRLGDPTESFLNGKAAANVPTGAPGRGINDTGHQILIGLPRIDGSTRTDDLATGVAQLVAKVAANWPARRTAPPVRMLPSLVDFTELPPGDPDGSLSIGVTEQNLEPIYLWPAIDPHFLVFGHTQSGKTSFLRMLADRIVKAYSPDQARILLVDYRLTLLDVVPQETLIGYGTNPSTTLGLITEVVKAMAERLPGPDVSPEQLIDRSWWKGSDLYVLIDDYDLVTGSHGNPLAQLDDYLAKARDIGLHLIVARRTGGAARAMFDPIIQQLREIGTPGVVLSGDPDEGPLLGTVRPSAQPPGRGYLVDRDGNAQLVQLAWSPPSKQTATGGPSDR